MTVAVGGQDLGLKGRTAILDTGTTLIIAPAADAAAVHAAIPGAKSDGQGGFTIPCTTTTQVALTFGGQSFAIDPRDMLFAPVDPNDLTGDCVSGISSGNIGGAQEWLVRPSLCIIDVMPVLTKCAHPLFLGRRRVPEERLLLDRRDEEPDFACHAQVIKGLTGLLGSFAVLCSPAALSFVILGVDLAYTVPSKLLYLLSRCTHLASHVRAIHGFETEALEAALFKT